jgi:hypothetical protein
MSKKHFSHLIAQFSVRIFLKKKMIISAWLHLSKQGGVGLRIRVYDRIMCFVNCHLAAHLEAVNRRNADFDHIFRNMVFSRSSNLLNAAGMVPYLFLFCSLVFSTYLFWLLYSSGLPLILSVAAGVSTSAHMLRGANVCPYDGYDFLPFYKFHFHLHWLTVARACYFHRLGVASLKNQGPSYLKQIWLYFLVTLITGFLVYLMMRQGTLFRKDALIGSEKRTSSERRCKLEKFSKECERQS